MIYIRSLFANVFFFGTIGIGCVLTLFVAPFSRDLNMKMWDRVIMKIAFFWMCLFAKLKMEFRGLENVLKTPALYACKHESAMETYAFTHAVERVAYVMKKELTYIPFFGWGQYFYGMIPIDRKAGAKAMKMMLKECADRVAKGRPVVVFPEGTRCKPGTTKGYKSGFLFVAENLGLKVVPVAINTGLFWTKNSFLRYPGTAVFEFLEPMEAKKGIDKHAFMNELESRIEKKCKELNEEAVQKYPWVKHNLN